MYISVLLPKFESVKVICCIVVLEILPRAKPEKDPAAVYQIRQVCMRSFRCLMLIIVVILISDGIFTPLS
jgi:hypothetical protein